MWVEMPAHKQGTRPGKGSAQPKMEAPESTKNTKNTYIHMYTEMAYMYMYVSIYAHMRAF